MLSVIDLLSFACPSHQFNILSVYCVTVERSRRMTLICAIFSSPITVNLTFKLQVVNLRETMIYFYIETQINTQILFHLLLRKLMSD